MQSGNKGFFQKVIMSIKDFDQYLIFATEKLSEALKYLLKIMLIFSASISIGFTYFFYVTVQEGIQYFNNHIESIQYLNHELMVNEDNPTIIENDELIIPYIVIDTSQTEENNTYMERASLYDTAVIILKDKILVKNPVDTSGITTYSYEELENQYQIGDFNKEQVLDFISQINQPTLYLGVYISIFLYMFLVYTISTIFDVLILALLGYIIARIARVKLRLNATFNIGVHALTLPIILNLIYILVNLFTGFTIKYFQWMYTTISYIYVIVAILMIKTDIINTQIELAKIVKEQEKVRQELEEEKKEEGKKESKKDKEGQKQDEEEQEDDGQPDSSEA